MFGVSDDRLSPALYLQMAMRPLLLQAQPMVRTPLHTSAVRWPVGRPPRPL